MPDISVIIPCYNQGHYLHEAIDSVLSQTHSNLEIIVVDDGSTDSATRLCMDKLNRSRTKLLRRPNGGLASARNTGIKAAAGRYILPLDCDDMLAPDYLKKAICAMEAATELGIVYCHAEKFGAESGPWKLPPYSRWRILLGNIIFCSALYRRSDWEKVGGYDETLRRGWEDWDFWLSLLELGRDVYCLPEVGFYYRKHEHSMATGMEWFLKAALHRRLIDKHPAAFGIFSKTPQTMLELYYRIAAGDFYRSLKKSLGR